MNRPLLRPVCGLALLLSAQFPAHLAAQPTQTTNPIDAFNRGVRGGFAPDDQGPKGQPARRVQDAVEALGRQLDATPSRRDQERILREGLPDVVPVLTSTDMDAVPPAVRNRYMNALADVLNQLAGKDHKDSYESSLRLTDNVLTRSPDDKDALNNRAVSNLGLGRLDSAIKDASAAAALDPASERAFTTRALAYYNQGNYPQALEDARRALALNKNNETAFYIVKVAEGRVTTAEHLGLNAQERAAAERVKAEYQALERQAGAGPVVGGPAGRADPGRRQVEDHLRAAAQYLAQRNAQGAVESSNKALASDPENLDALYQRSAAENMLGQCQKAADDAARVLAASPNHAKALIARAAALVCLDRLEEARLDCDRAIGQDPNYALAYRTRARLEQKLGDIAGWLSDLRRASSLDRQFQGEYFDAAAAHRVLPKVPAFAPRDEALAARRRRDGSLIVLACSLLGGALLACGAVSILLRRSRRATRTRRGKAPTGERDGIEAGYEILRAIGRGGMGEVFEGKDRALGRKVAIKRMRDEIKLDRAQRKRFIQEARIVASLHHPHIVDIHAIVEEGSDLYLVFEFVAGHTVEEVLARRKRLPLAEARHIVRGVAAALEFAHKSGVVHRDLKPSNIMVAADGQVKVMDFGIARQAKDSLAKSTATGTVAGTPLYMAPEQEQGIVRKESDLYALGACLYEMVTGERPFPGPMTTASKLAKQYKRPSRVTAGLPPQLDALVDAALEPDPDLRIPSAAEFRARLDAIPEPSSLKA